MKIGNVDVVDILALIIIGICLIGGVYTDNLALTTFGLLGVILLR